VFEADNRACYAVKASVRYEVAYRALIGGAWVGPYPMGSLTLNAPEMIYPVVQAQPELVSLM